MDWDVFICQVDVYCAALYGAESVLGMRGERETDSAASRQAAALSEVAVCARAFQTAQTHTGKRGKEEKKEKNNSATHD